MDAPEIESGYPGCTSALTRSDTHIRAHAPTSELSRLALNWWEVDYHASPYSFFSSFSVASIIVFMRSPLMSIPRSLRPCDIRVSAI